MEAKHARIQELAQRKSLNRDELDELEFGRQWQAKQWCQFTWKALEPGSPQLIFNVSEVEEGEKDDAPPSLCLLPPLPYVIEVLHRLRHLGVEIDDYYHYEPFVGGVAGILQLLERALEEAGKARLVEDTDEYGNTALTKAFQHDDEDIVKVLLAAGAKVPLCIRWKIDKRYLRVPEGATEEDGCYFTMQIVRYSLPSYVANHSPQLRPLWRLLQLHTLLSEEASLAAPSRSTVADYAGPLY